jgi:hypothetical protein
MRDALVYGIEMLVGVACAVAGGATFKRSRVLGVLLIALGVLAVGHAAWAWFLSPPA